MLIVENIIFINFENIVYIQNSEKGRIEVLPFS
jgi:hypothetical protein